MTVVGKGPEPDITAVIQERTSDPVRPGGSVTLQCSVLSDSENKTCPEEQRVFWFRAGSDESYPSVIYAHGTSDGCEKSPEAHSPQKCFYSFSKNVSSSDAGTYYCAVATCGEILFGSGTELDIEALTMWDLQKDDRVLILLVAVLAMSLIVIAVLIYATKKNKCDYCNNEAAVSLLENVAKRNLKRNEDTWIYSTVVFTVMESGSGGTRNAKAAEREKIYAAVKAFGLD
ncbi:hypothetical protein VZT92_023668 [Zoarces viviparus]|uniref:Ig-like domain-containing protein n=1 Tax=Zoarces viviparus TaxID=48416 RepID=A0AAW1E713_ZOAVI